MRIIAVGCALASMLATGSGAQQVLSPPPENVGPDLITPARIHALKPAQQAAWNRYVAESRKLHAMDSTAVAAELRAAGVAKWTLPTYSAPDFPYGNRPDAWLGTDSARTIANAVLTFQTPSGGWSKRTDMTHPRPKGTGYYSEIEAWHYIPTFDNGATTGQLRLLGRMSQRDTAYASAFRRGLALIKAAQMPNGCWPQSYPLEGGYHDAITFNDDAVVLIVQLLEDAAAGTVGTLTHSAQKDAAAQAARGLDCILETQVVLDGKRTVWGQQHDPFALAVPVRARTYEIPGLSGRESAAVMEYLMSIKAPSARVVAAVHGAADWFKSHETHGVRYDPKNGVHVDSSGGPVWARLTEIGTDRPIFANRDGIKLYDWTKLTDRRLGYGWFSEEPANALKEYESWSAAHPRTPAHKESK